MEYEHSCGAVLYTVRDGEIYYIIVVAPDLVCGFPKGHTEAGESERETALREIYEETGVAEPKFVDGFCERIEYSLPNKPNTLKTVTYFLAECGECALTVPPRELSGLCRLPFEKALQVIKHNDLKSVLEKADSFIRKTFYD